RSTASPPASRRWPKPSPATASIRPAAATSIAAWKSRSRSPSIMPKGDTIYRAAVTLRPAMEGGTIVEARLRDRQFEVDRLLGALVRQVEARGKHLLMHLSTGDVIHSHMGMTGSWHIYRPGQPWRKPEHYAALFLS